MTAPENDASTMPLPRDWPSHVTHAVVQVVGLANAAISVVRGWCQDSLTVRRKLASKAERLEAEIAQLHVELDLLRSRLSRVPAKNRPHYTPVERLRILELKAVRGWNSSQLAKRLLLSPSTVTDWLDRLRARGQDEFIRVPVPVNKFPDYVGLLVQEMKTLLPQLGNQKVQQVLARSGLHLAASTVANLAKRKHPVSPPQPPISTASPGAAGEPSNKPQRTVTAREPNHVWHIDLTVVPTGGFWVPWLPFTVPTFWPFSWHVGIVLDHFSRKVLAASVYCSEPSSAEICALLERAEAKAGALPGHIISDKGAQFFGRDEETQYQLWCKERGVKTRFGAVGKKGSIAVIERFMLSLKQEALRRVIVPMGIQAMQCIVEQYLAWYNGCRPHTALGGRTPDEVFEGRAAANQEPRFEPRTCYPLRPHPARAAPMAVRGKRGVVVDLVVPRLHDQPHLPVVELRRGRRGRPGARRR
jgi:putative transposase